MGVARRALLGLALAGLAGTARADQRQFCAGFADGWRGVFENRGMIPAIAPICPIPPIGRDTYAGGFEMGMTAALRHLSSRGR